MKAVFLAGSEGYQCFRIPAVVKAENGDLIAFAEGRKNGCSDTGDIDLVMKRSSDRGKTWGPLEIIWDDSTNTCGNPAPIIDMESGTIHLLSTWNLGADRERAIIDRTSIGTRKVYVIHSKDHGKSWDSPRDITSAVKLPEWTWYATGPGSGTQLTHAPYKGRLILGCDHIEAESKKYFSHIIYSDDQGVSWQLGGTTPKDQVNECEIAALSDGRLALNMRNYDRNQKQRQIAISIDGGLNWKEQKHHPSLIEPICQGSFQSHKYKDRHLLLFSNPANTESRVNMCLRLSWDDGQTWPDSLVLHEGPSAYSDLLPISENEVGCLFEAGKERPYEGIVWSVISLD